MCGRLGGSELDHILGGWTGDADLVQLGVVNEVGPVPVDERAESQAIFPAASRGEEQDTSQCEQRRRQGLHARTFRLSDPTA